MNDLRIDITDGRIAYEPGETITGTVFWKLEKPPRTVELRLFWFTRGKGTEDAGVVETISFEKPAEEGSRPFRLRLPGMPYSFSGKLISLCWALELVSAPAKAVARTEITMAPGGQEVRLEALPDPAPIKLPFGMTRSP